MDKSVEMSKLVKMLNNYTKAYVRHLIVCNKMLGGRLLSIHNIRFLIREVENIRKTIKDETFDSYMEEFIKRYKK